MQSGQGADEIFAGYDWYPPLANVARAEAPAAYAQVFVDRSDAAVTGIARVRGGIWTATRHAPSSPSISRQPGADTALDAALRIDSQIMLVDDPVKRVDNMTMAWGLEARVPFLDHEVVELAALCPPELKLAGGGKGVLKEASRKVLPAEVIDRKKGYFPVPAIRHLSGALLDRVSDALTSQAARDRGLYEPEPIRRLLADPNVDAHDAGLQRAVAGGAARDVAAGAGGGLSGDDVRHASAPAVQLPTSEVVRFRLEGLGECAGKLGRRTLAGRVEGRVHQ